MPSTSHSHPTLSLMRPPIICKIWKKKKFAQNQSGTNNSGTEWEGKEGKKNEGMGQPRM